MPFQAYILKVLIASPGDVKTEREAIAKEIEEWNRGQKHSADNIRLEVHRWEVDAVPQMGSDVQSVINRQLVDDVDIVIAVFHSRLGTPTSRAVSGTAEEIDRTLQAGKTVHVYFSKKPMPVNHDAKQLKSVTAFQKELSARGYAGTFSSTADLKRQIRLAITMDVDKFKDRSPAEGRRSSPAKQRMKAEPATTQTTDSKPRRSTTKPTKTTAAKKIARSGNSGGAPPRKKGPIFEVSVGSETTIGSSGGLGPAFWRSIYVRNIGDQTAHNVFVATSKRFSMWEVKALESEYQEHLRPRQTAVFRENMGAIPKEIYVGWIEDAKVAYARCDISQPGVDYRADRI
jgi:hypothetical protein